MKFSTLDPSAHENSVSIEKSFTDDYRIRDQSAVRARINRLSRLMDTAIPLPGGYRIGWDGIIGLVPGFGDAAGMLVSLYIVSGARRSGASWPTVIRMLLNVGIETLIGALPVIGDLFDLVFKANTRNMEILNRQLDQPTETSRESQRKLWLVGLVAAGAFVLALYVVVRVVGALIRWVF